MNPLLLSALGQGLGMAANAAFGQRGQRNPVDAAADAAGAAFVNTPGMDTMAFGEDILSRARRNLDPNGAYSRGFEQSNARQAQQQFNVNKKMEDEKLKRSYVVDSYKQAARIGENAIDAYIGQQAQMRNQMGQLMSGVY